SGIGPVDELRGLGLPVVHALPGVGKNLHDHLYVDARSEIAEPLTLIGLSPAESEAAQRQCLADGTGPFATNPLQARPLLRCDPASEYPDIQLHFMASFGVGYFEGAPPDRHGIALSANVCRPASRGELRLNSADPLDRPLIDPRYLSDPADVALTL